MKAAIIRIGNSRGVRIPMPLLKECGFREEVELEVRKHEIIIRSARSPRQGWEDAFRHMAPRGDDTLTDKLEEIPTEWDRKEWKW
ncbi:MAG: AbrB/MazE/SpoVT family DNA-binding domain-containing protein [Planctomycetes bacterium]|nr:AbrB/MazE/SpoVT family DNA-binding domain-containing protein [Planctomycetota bacterium]